MQLKVYVNCGIGVTSSEMLFPESVIISNKILLTAGAKWLWTKPFFKLKL